MSKPAARTKSRLNLFSVGRNKASPARTASIKRASFRRSVLATEAVRMQAGFRDAGEADAETEADAHTAAMASDRSG